MSTDHGGAPTFSVVMIFHNEERFLAAAVASVAAQVGPAWELILVDDGSTDRSGDIARNLATSFPGWIRCLGHPGGGNRGMSASRNLGIAEARGRWITFLDADDTWTAGKLAGQLDLLARHPDVNVLVSPACWWRSWDPAASEPDWHQDLLGVLGRQVAATSPSVVDDQAPDHRIVAPPHLVTMFLDDEWTSICDLVVHRDVIADVGGYEPTFTGMFEDQVLHTKVLSRFPAIVTRDSWYRYRQHDATCTAAAHEAGTHLAARLTYLRWAARHLATADPPDAGEWRGLVERVGRLRRQTRFRLFRQRLPARPKWLR